MSNKWAGLNGPITAADAEAEPIDQRLFGPDFDRRQRAIRARSEPDGIDKTTFKPWKKPRIVRSKEAKGEPV